MGTTMEKKTELTHKQRLFVDYYIGASKTFIFCASLSLSIGIAVVMNYWLTNPPCAPS